MYNLKHTGDYQIYREATGLKAPKSWSTLPLLNGGIKTGTSYERMEERIEGLNMNPFLRNWFHWFEPILEEVKADV